jgi:Baseplate J-like protein
MQQVIYLEVEDDMPAVRELLEGAQAKRVLLVVPKGCDTLRQTVNLRVLRRYAANMGLDVGLVTRDSRTRQLAKEEGFAVLSSVGRGQRRRWRGGMPRRSAAQQAAAARVDGLRYGRGDVGYGDRAIVWAGRFLGIALFAVLLLVVVGLAVLVVPEGKVTLTPYRQPIEVVLDLRADPDLEESSLEKLAIPARVIQAQVEDTGEIATINKKDAPDEPATGMIVFINQTAQGIEITPGVIVRTSTGTTVRFTTVTTATLEPRIGARAEAEIKAMEPGPVGNVPAATITTIETSALRAKVRVTNETATRGGGVRQVGVVTRADMDRLKAQLLQQLQDRAWAELLVQLKEGEFLPEASLTVEIMAEVYDQFLDAEADTLHLQMRILASSTAVNRANANGLAYEALKDRIPAGYDLESKDIVFTLNEDEARVDGRSVLVTTKAVAYLVTAVDRGEVRSVVAGLTPEKAVQVLADSFTLGGPPLVEVQPDWIKRFKWLDRVPWLPFRIQVIVLE